MDVLYLVRHGETEWNRQQRMQGRLDSRLTAEGRAHARAHAALLAREAVEHLFVSPLGRTRETADLILENCEVPVTYDDRLVERSNGAWEGLTIDEIAQRFPDEWAARIRDPFHHRPPAGENLPDVVARIAPFADQLRRAPGRKLAVVSHGIAARAFLTHFLGLAPTQVDLVRQPNDVVYRLDFSGGEGAAVRCDHYRGGAGPHPGLFVRAPDQAG
ncbi:MAG TPA: histidine phosphatase family protein [Pseudomonadales bacterium]|nr:histidine phosphatase family protein [Pseudomonadales bacterium]